MPRGSRPGERRGGRQKGTPNKVTRAVKDAILSAFEKVGGWATGPAEILRHGVNLLSDDSDASRRIAMILIDNGVDQVLYSMTPNTREAPGVPYLPLRPARER